MSRLTVDLKCLSLRGAAVVALVVGTMVGCERGTTTAAPGPSTQPAPVSVSVSPIERVSANRTVDVVGTLFADQDVLISAKVPGRIISLQGDVGDRLPPGAILAEIDPTDYRMAVEMRTFALRQALADLDLTELPAGEFDPSKVPTVERARFELDNAQARLERVRKLFEVPQPLIPEQDFADRKTEAEVARRNLEVAELAARSLLAQARTRDSERAAAVQRLADATIRTPTAAAGGVGPDAMYAIAERRVSVGEYVREGDPLFRVVSDTTIRFRGAVAERFGPQVSLGQPVLLRIDGQSAEFTGKIARISPAIDTSNRTFQIEADFPNATRLLRPGAFGRAKIVVGESSGNARVPAAAVVSFAGIDRVYAVSAGKAVEIPVTRLPTPTSFPPNTVLLAGIPAEVTSVVTSGTARLARNVAVTVVDRPTTAATTAPSTPESRR